MMVSMLVNFKYDQLLTFENEKFKILCFQIDMCVKVYLPKVHEIFVRSVFINVYRKRDALISVQTSMHLLGF